MIKKILFISLILFFIAVPYLRAEAPKKAEIYFFWQEGCPHCAREEEFLERLKEKYPEIEVKSFEISNSAENRELFKKLSEACGEKMIGTPTTFIGDRVIIGYLNNLTTGKEIEEEIKKCLESGCSVPGEKIISDTACKNDKNWKVNLPIIGEIDFSKMSLPVLTVVIGTLDGFNPCAMWVLVLLISLLLGSKSRKRIWQIGGIFILSSGILYYLFMTAWLNLFLAISYIALTRIIVGAAAIGVGIWRIRDFFVYKPGTCKVTDNNQTWRQKTIERVKRVVQPAALPATLLGVVALAFGVNLIELFCSAGLPAIYTRILTLSNLNPLSYYLYIFVYTFFFMLDDMLIFAIAIITLNKIGFTDKYNKFSAIFGGILILLLGLLLIFKPGILMFG